MDAWFYYYLFLGNWKRYKSTQRSKSTTCTLQDTLQRFRYTV